MAERRSITAHLTVRNAVDAIAFYQKAFGFTEAYRIDAPDGKVLHCELQLGNSAIFVADEFPHLGSNNCVSPQALGGSTVTLDLDSPDVDAAFARAVAAGASVIMPLENMFWGDRYGKLLDPFGHHWSLSTHKENLSPQEIKRRAAELMSQKRPR